MLRTPRASSMAPNSSTSAPAMNPFAFPERMTRPFGGCASSASSTCANPASTLFDSVFVVASARSRVSHAMPSASRVSDQCRMPACASSGSCTGSVALTGLPSALRASGLTRAWEGPARSYALDEHRAALAAANADRGDTPASAGAQERLENMHHDANAGCADRMAERDRAAIGVELLGIDRSERAAQAELVAAERVVLPCAKAREHLRCECLVDFPRVDILKTEPTALEQRRDGVHRTQTHLGRVERRPLRIDDASLRHQAVPLDRLFGGEQQPGGPVGDLRAVPRGDVAVLSIEERPQLREIRGCRILPYTVVGLVDVARAVVQRHDLAREAALALRGQRTRVALRREFVHLASRDAETIGEVLC